MEYRLKELLEFKYGKSQKNVESLTGKYPIYGTSGIMNYADSYIYDKPTVLFGRKGSIEKVQYIEKPFWAIDTTFYTIIDELKVIPQYLFYKLSQINFKDYDEGTTIPSLRIQALNEIIIDIPEINIQKSVLAILSKIDKKIELNNYINDNLFKFAINYINNKIEESEVPISKFAKIQGGYAFKSKDLLDDKTNNRIIKIKNLRNEINADVIDSQYVEDEVANSIDSKFKLNKGDVTIAMTGAELGKTGFIYGFDRYYLNQRVGVIRGKNKERELYLKILFLSNKFQTLLNSKGYGSAQPNISTNDIESILINDITEDNLKEIYKRLNSVYYRIISNCEENLNLAQLRDTLLPKLMNGEVDLDKIEI